MGGKFFVRFVVIQCCKYAEGDGSPGFVEDLQGISVGDLSPTGCVGGVFSFIFCG